MRRGRRSLRAALLLALLAQSILGGHAALAANPAPVQTSFCLLPDPVTVFTQQTIQVGLSPAADGGTIELRIDGQTYDTQDFTGNCTQFSWTPQATGTYTFQAFFSGTSAYAASQTTEQTVHVVPPVPNSVTVTSDQNPVARNASALYTATILPNPGPGSVDWYATGVDGVAATTTIDGTGKATWSHAFDTAGPAAVWAKFMGNDDYSPRMSNQYDVTVNGDGLTVSVSVPGGPFPPGPVSGSVTLTPNPGGGYLNWKICQFCAENQTAVDADGTTTLDLGTLTPSQYTLYVTFTGHGNYAAASGQAGFEVGYVTSTTAVTDRTTAYAGEIPVKLTATVSSETGLYGGTVTFLDNVAGSVVQLGPVTLDQYTNKAVFSSSSLRVGVHSVTARFNHMPAILQSTSAPVLFTVYADTAVHATFAPSLSTFYPTADGYKDTTHLGGTLSEKVTAIVIKAINSSGTTKRTWNYGAKNPGTYGPDWNGRTSGGTKLPAGKYKVTATITDTKAHKKTFTSYVTISWRSVVWKSVTVTKYGESGTYFVSEFGGVIYYSPDYPRGRILDSGEMIRDCTECGAAAGRFRFQLVNTTAVLTYRRLHIETRGHGFSDREHTGQAFILNPKNGALALPASLPLYDEIGATWGIAFTTSYINTAKQVEAWLSMRQAWGDAWDVNYLRLTYQYAVWA